MSDMQEGSPQDLGPLGSLAELLEQGNDRGRVTFITALRNSTPLTKIEAQVSFLTLNLSYLFFFWLFFLYLALVFL